MKILICWSNIAGYTAACWRSLLEQPGVELEVIAFRPAAGSLARFDPEGVLAGIPCTLIEQREPDHELIRRRIDAFKPDVVLTAGWLFPPYRKVLLEEPFRRISVVMGLDLPWQGTVRQRLAPHALRAWLRRVQAVFVCGERAWQYARKLGFAESQISRGLYGVDTDRLQRLLERREALPGGWPRAFAFAGRYIDIKGIPDLQAAYGLYRGRVEDPWPLRCCGSGGYAAALQAAEGVEDHGFLQPEELAGFLASAGVYVMPSRFDPWPLAVVEACAAGLPVIATEACGSTVENVRPAFNGWLCPTSNPERLADAMIDAHRSHARLPWMGRNSWQMAQAYASERWAERLMGIARRLAPTAGRGPAGPQPDDRPEPETP